MDHKIRLEVDLAMEILKRYSISGEEIAIGKLLHIITSNVISNLAFSVRLFDYQQEYGNNNNSNNTTNQANEFEYAARTIFGELGNPSLG